MEVKHPEVLGDEGLKFMPKQDFDIYFDIEGITYWWIRIPFWSFSKRKSGNNI